MPTYHIFEKAYSYDYKYKGTSTGSNPNQALNRKMETGRTRNDRFYGISSTIKRKGVYLCIPDSQFTKKWQVNPTTKGTGKEKITTWKKPK
tara:strand:+ start:41 stop:313 length:273 start_codon:yes stop_codon:yes gene_type:complete